MAGTVDYAALVLDLRGRLAERPSWGTPQLRELLDSLEQDHRVDEGAEAAMLRHFGAHLQDAFLGLLPEPVTSDPLTVDDRQGDVEGDGSGHTIRSHQEDECLTPPVVPPQPPLTRSQTPGQGSRRAGSPATLSRRAPALT